MQAAVGWVGIVVQFVPIIMRKFMFFFHFLVFLCSFFNVLVFGYGPCKFVVCLFDKENPKHKKKQIVLEHKHIIDICTNTYIIKQSNFTHTHTRDMIILSGSIDFAIITFNWVYHDIAKHTSLNINMNTISIVNIYMFYLWLMFNLNHISYCEQLWLLMKNKNRLFLMIHLEFS